MRLTRRAAFILDLHLPLPGCLNGSVRGARMLLRNFIFSETPKRQSLKEKPPKSTTNPKAVHTVYRNTRFCCWRAVLDPFLPLSRVGSAGTLAWLCANKGKCAARPERKITKLSTEVKCTEVAKRCGALSFSSDVSPTPGWLTHCLRLCSLPPAPSFSPYTFAALIKWGHCELKREMVSTSI